MKSFIVNIALILSFAQFIVAQELTKENAEFFIKALISNSNDLENYFDASELSQSKRLEISYVGTKHKFLISQDIDSPTKEKLLNKSLNYHYEIQPLDSGYSKLIFEIPQENLKKEYIFSGNKLISRPNYYSRNWENIQSKYFTFHVREISLLNNYSINNLDSFVENTLTILKCSEDKINKLRQEKIHYFLCGDDSEIKQLTGYSARGLYYLASDYIISTFNSHYHEIAHLLINYKLKNVPLYTLPFLQEGFAVALGGRGGKEPNVILNMGLFLAKSNFVDYSTLLSKPDFYQYDVSMSYPVVGLYVDFLIESQGIDNFLELYTKYSSDVNKINNIKISAKDLPDKIKWENYLQTRTERTSLNISNVRENDFPDCLISQKDISVYVNSDAILIKMKNNFTLKSENNFPEYDSKLFKELFPTKTYSNEKYAVTATAEEISVYNLFTNNLIAKYVRGFSLTNDPVRQKEGFYIFSIDKSVFDDSIKSVQLIPIVE